MCYLGGYFRLESKAILLNCYPLYYFPPENFVAGLHIGEVEICEHVRKEREEIISHRVPEVKYAMGLRSDES